MRYLFLFAFIQFAGIATCPVTDEAFESFEALLSEFAEGYPRLDIAPWRLSYVTNFQSIQDEKGIEKQLSFFQKYAEGLENFNIDSLTQQQQVDYLMVAYEVNLNLKRLELEADFLKNKDKSVLSKGGIIHVPNSKEWYRFYLDKWIGEPVDPDALFEFGHLEIQKVQNAMENIRIRSGLEKEAFDEFLLDPSFEIEDGQVVQDAFEAKRDKVRKRLPLIFFNPDRVYPVKIARGTNRQLSRVPGYYTGGTFYYNLFDEPFNTRDYDYLIIHEGSPGHHFQSTIASQLDLPDYRSFLWYSGFSEGWAAYVEELGKLVGLYETPYDYYGKWEWDLVRSVRVCLDIGLNYYGWTDEKAIAFWNIYIPGKEKIGWREIDRMKNWPAQVHTYKFGAAKIMLLKAFYQDEMGAEYDIRTFHELILNAGSMPMAVLEKYFSLATGIPIFAEQESEGVDQQN